MVGIPTFRCDGCVAGVDSHNAGAASGQINVTHQLGTAKISPGVGKANCRRMRIDVDGREWLSVFEEPCCVGFVCESVSARHLN